ncbi:MAG: endolytic transglycosylase MltG [bacterium]|nr:endolytic transglycosylase MltG [bacterium]
MSFILVGGIILAAVLILFSVFYFNGLKPIGSDIKFELKIEKGQGLKEISAALSQARIIRSITVFKLYAIFTGKARHLKSGIYQLNGRLSVPEIINFLIDDSSQEVSITITEGSTLKEIDRILSSANIIPKNSLVSFYFPVHGGSAAGGKNDELIKAYPFLEGIDNLEGFLYPDTYRFKIDSSVEEAAKKFFDNFQNKAWPLISQKNNWYQILILASILEKEVPVFNDQQLVAGILNKRIKVGMPIQVDATVLYTKCQGDFYSCSQRKLSTGDLKLDSPYNTYLNLGLPPTPIANPGQMAIQAALSPKASNYWFYLSDSQTKETIFSETLEDQNKNRQKYL